jgi:nucleoside phosphorylase
MPLCRSRRSAAGLLLAAALLVGCGSSDDQAAEPQLIAVLSAFPAELAAVLEQASVEETVVVDGRTFRTGRIGDVPVVMAMTGIGLLNAAATTSLALDHFPITGVVVSGVAGSPRRIADVVVPRSWSEIGGASFAADSDWLARVERLARTGRFALEDCTTVSNAAVCLSFAPAVVVGGEGSSSDSFGSVPFKCNPRGGDVFGCDVAAPAAAARAALQTAPRAAVAVAEPSSVDMETAAIAAAAAQRGIPYIAFRAVSDGAEDPLGLPGFPAQFFAYYPLAAHNAAAAAATFVRRLGG